MYRVLPILTREEVEECRKIAATAPFIDGRFTNPHNTAKVNEQLHDQQAYQRTAKLLHGALVRSEDFRNFAFPILVAPPLMTRYQPGIVLVGHLQALERGDLIQIEQQVAPERVRDPALDERDPDQAFALGNRYDLVQRVGGVDDRLAGVELETKLSVAELDA
jgi:predicted 2-oxoglutarate/Fe(II)-dependent dioxygenase YbiX